MSLTSLAPNRVLVVDDEPGLLRMVRTALGRHGFLTEGAQDGRDALECIQKFKFDVVITDINMPGSGGLEFLRSARARNPDVPVILMTGNPTVASSNRAVEFGAFLCLVKPVVPSVLLDSVERAVARRASGTHQLLLGDQVLAIRCAACKRLTPSGVATCECCGKRATDTTFPRS